MQGEWPLVHLKNFLGKTKSYVRFCRIYWHLIGKVTLTLWRLMLMEGISFYDKYYLPLFIVFLFQSHFFQQRGNTQFQSPLFRQERQTLHLGTPKWYAQCGIWLLLLTFLRFHLPEVWHYVSTWCFQLKTYYWQHLVLSLQHWLIILFTPNMDMELPPRLYRLIKLQVFLFRNLWELSALVNMCNLYFLCCWDSTLKDLESCTTVTTQILSVDLNINPFHIRSTLMWDLNNISCMQFVTTLSYPYLNCSVLHQIAYR